MTDEEILVLFQIIFSNIQNLGSIDLDFIGSQISNSSIVLLFEKFISQISDLEVLKLDFNRTKISSSGIKALINNTKKFMDNLVEFELCLGSTNVTDEDIISIFYPMPKAKYFYLHLKNTRISDTIKILTNKIKKMENLNDFRFYLPETNVTIETIFCLIESLKHMKILYLDLGGIKINNEFIIKLDKLIGSKMKNLKEFYLELEQNLDQPGQDLLDKIHNDYPFSLQS